MLYLLRHASRHVILALAAGLLLRLWFIHYYPVVEGDSLVYGELARNWFWNHIYGFTRATGIHPTLIRLPGYPLLLAICFSIFGIGHYGPILGFQALLDLSTCLLLAGFCARALGKRTGIATLYLAALCPFTANYVASPLTETPTLFCIALGLYALLRYVERPAYNGWFWAMALSISYAAMLRPDGALWGLVLVPAMFWYAVPRTSTAASLKMALVCTLLSLLPFSVWTIRNAITMHVFQPLAPRYANDPNEYIPRGWIRWVQSWSADYASTAEIYWNVNGAPIDVNLLPSRAFDNPKQKLDTSTLFADYNRAEVMSPALSHRFGKLAQQRIRQNPLRFYVELPVLRLADMWLRPRTEALWIELRWWEYKHHPAETIFSWCYGALNLGYLLLAAWGIRRRVAFAPVMLAYVVARCLLLLTLETPESRYTLECFPIVFVFAGAALGFPGGSDQLTSAPPESWSPS